MPGDELTLDPATLARLDAVSRLTARTAGAGTLDEILGAALDAVEQALGARRAAILLSDPDGVLRFTAWRGLSDAYRQAAESHSPWSAGSSEDEPVLVPDVGADDRLGSHRAASVAEGIGALAAFPLRQSGHVLGQLVAYHDRPRRLTSVEVQLARILAGQVAGAVAGRRTEEALRARERDLADFFENASVGLHWVGADGTIRRVNQAELDLLGYRREEYVGRHVSEFHADRHVVEDILARLRRGETLREYEARLRHKDGTIRYVLMDASALVEEGRVVHTRCVTRDITDRKHVGEASQRLAAIVESSDDAIVSKNTDGIIQTWNPGAERLFGHTAEQAIGQPAAMLIPPEHVDEEPNILARIRRGERIEHYETVRIRRDGRRIDVSLSVSPVRNAAGVIIGASKIARDITEAKRAAKEREELLAREQEARAEAEAASRAKDEFLATLSHELRTPLNAILGWTHVLGRARHDPRTVDRALETISRNARHQTRLIEDLLDLSSIMGGRLRLNPRPVDLVAVLAAALETIRPATDAKQLEIQTHFDPLVGAVSGDPERLQQVFWNLLSNAVKFTPRHGRVDVRLERTRSRAIVQVSDSGIGIRPDMLPVIFERFRQADSSITRAHGGLGLGLAIVRQLVELHGGTVEAASPGEGQGATFTVSLPIAPLREGPPGAVTSPRDDTARCEGIHMLLVDDETDSRDLLAMVVEQYGGEVTAAESAMAALVAIERRRPDVLVSDLAMPGMDGYELIRRVRSLPGGESIPAIALTAHATADARVKAFQAGFDTYLTKPVDAAELIAAVARLGRRSAEA